MKHSITAFIYDKKGTLLSVGRNSYVKTHPFQAKLAKQCGKPDAVYQHAEINALIKVRDWSKAYKIEIFRFTKDGKPGLAKPCPICQKAIALAGIKKVIHT